MRKKGRPIKEKAVLASELRGTGHVVAVGSVFPLSNAMGCV